MQARSEYADPDPLSHFHPPKACPGSFSPSSLLCNSYLNEGLLHLGDGDLLSTVSLLVQTWRSDLD